MSIPTNNDTEVKEYNKISKFKDLNIKIWYLKTGPVLVVVRALGEIKKRIVKLIHKVQ